MPDPSQPDRPAAAGGSGRGGGIPVVRAAAVLIVFVVVTILLLGVIHPSTSTSASGPAPTTTTTTRPSHPTTTTTTFPPSKVPVLVANASAVTGAAEATAKELQPQGWDLLPAVNATAQVPASSIYYLAGQEQSAKAIAATLKLPDTVVAPYTTAAPISSVGTAEVIVVVGPALATQVTSTTTATTAAP